jgi:hypothetical protein
VKQKLAQAAVSKLLTLKILVYGIVKLRIPELPLTNKNISMYMGLGEEIVIVMRSK